MATDFKFPDVGEGLTEGKLVEWKVKKGDALKANETIIASVETDKAVVDIPSSIDGTVDDLLFNPGDTLTVGETIMKVGDGSGGTSAPAVSQMPEDDHKIGEAPPDLKIGHGDHVIGDAPEDLKIGDKEHEVHPDAKIPDVSVQPPLTTAKPEEKKAEEPKAEEQPQPEEHSETTTEEKPAEPTAPEEPKVEEPKTTEPEAPKVEEKPAAEPTPAEEEKKEAPSVQPEVHAEGTDDGILAMPGVRALAKEKNIDLSKVKGTGSQGQITIEDLGGAPEEEAPIQEMDGHSGDGSVTTRPVSESDMAIAADLPTEPELKKDIVIPEHIQEGIEEIDVGKIKTEQPSSTPQKEILASPSVRQLARDLEVDINFVLGSGDNGKITEEDIRRAKENADKKKGLNGPHVDSPSSAPQTPPASSEGKTSIEKKIEEDESVTSKDAPKPESEITAEEAAQMEVKFDNVQKTEEPKEQEEKPVEAAVVSHNQEGGGSSAPSQVTQSEAPAPASLEKPASVETLTQDMRVPFTQIRNVIAKRMVESLQKAAQVTISDEATITKLVEFRNKEKQRLKEHGVKLTYLPFFMKAYMECCREFPYFNATVDDEKNEIVLRSEMNIGIAADTPKGLLVPVIKNANTKSIVDLAKDVVDLSTKAREGKLDPAEMSGSTFTISSVGSLGGSVFTPILNYPEVAILGIGRILKKPVVVGDEIEIGDVVTLSLTFDHRAVDGADAAKFLKKLIELLENPSLLLLEA